jgi:membrane-associated protease RseP (regulator of RpoE activity)
MGGDPAGFFSFGAVLDALPVVEARMLGIADGRALRVAETIPAVLRDFDAAPEPTLAARLGLRAGDVLVSVNGYLVADLHQLTNALEWSRRSGEIQATVIRGSRTLELSTR